MSEGTDWTSRYGSEPADGSGGSPRPPIWVVVVVVLSVIAGGWLFVTQGSPDGDAVAGTTVPFEPDLTTTTTVSAATTTTVSVATTPTLAPVDVSGFQTATVTAESPQQLRGYVAVASPDASSSQDTVWVFRPGGSVVSRGGNSITAASADRWVSEYPMLITAGRLIVGNQIFDIDLAEPPISLWTNASVFPGSGPGVVWLARHRGFSPAEWVAQVDVESLTVGEQVTDVSFIPVVGVADGLIVADFSHEGALFWSPTDGRVGVDLPDERGAILAGSGNLVVVATEGSVNVLDIRKRGFVSFFDLPAIGTFGASVCLSPDGQHVIIVGSNGEAVVGNIATGEVFDLNAVNAEFPIQQERGIGWTTDDQLVFIGVGEIGEREIVKRIIGFDVLTDESFDVATLDGPDDWWLTASGTMC